MLGLAPLLFWAAVFAQAQTSAPAPREDVYAIYSALLSSPDELILIQSDTLRYVSPVSGCVRPPQPETSDLAEIRADYERDRHVLSRCSRI